VRYNGSHITLYADSADFFVYKTQKKNLFALEMRGSRGSARKCEVCVDSCRVRPSLATNVRAALCHQ
jgi:hypothetical protein